MDSSTVGGPSVSRGGGRPAAKNVMDHLTIELLLDGKKKLICKHCGYTKQSKQTQTTVWAKHLLRCKDCPMESKVEIWKSSSAKEVQELGATINLDRRFDASFPTLGTDLYDVSSKSKTPDRKRKYARTAHIAIRTLKTVVFLGSSRNAAPPWGGDSRLGDRVLNWVLKTLQTRQATLGDESIQYDVTVVDPLEVFGDDGALAEISRGDLTVPTFFLKELPPKAAALKEQIANADCYLIVSPEYNHTTPPALASIMGHFGGSNYNAKPSGIITYSPGPWGGMRAAMSIQLMCHELGCLPVSKLCGLPMVNGLLQPDGTPVDPEHHMLKQLPGLLDQVDWMAVAMMKQRALTGTW